MFVISLKNLAVRTHSERGLLHNKRHAFGARKRE
jgi:hypothetical protein